MTQPLIRGRKMIGKYEIVDKIGEGGYGAVYRGYDPLIKREVAIKSCASTDAEMRERFHREAEIAGNLDHPNIVTVFDLGIEENTPYLVQELLGGEDLDCKIERRELIPFPEKLLYLIQVARGLDYAHRRGVVHRDVKPANVRILDDGTAKILDFGIAKLMQLDTGLTRAGMTMGTAAYLAPEQIHGQPAGSRTDIFSFGVLAYELLTCTRPFGQETISATLFHILNREPPPLQVAWPDCPGDLARLVERCLRKDPDRRYAGCGELLAELENIRDALREARGPRPGSGATQPLPLQAPPSASRHSLRLGTIPTAPGERPAQDLPLRSRPAGFQVAGVARRRPRRHWLSTLAVVAALGATGLWLDGGGLLKLRPLRRPIGPAFAPTASGDGAAGVLPSPETTETSPLAPMPAAADARAEPDAAPAIAAAGPPVIPAKEPRTGDASEMQVPGAPEAASVEPAEVTFDGPWSPGIRLSVDGGPPSALGRTQTLSLEPGDHSLTFSLSGGGLHLIESVRLDVAPGERRRLRVPLRPPGRLSVQARIGSPQGRVSIDGASPTLTPLRALPLAAGGHLLRILPGSGPPGPGVNAAVEVVSGRETVVTFDLAGGGEPIVRLRPEEGD